MPCDIEYKSELFRRLHCTHQIYGICDVKCNFICCTLYCM